MFKNFICFLILFLLAACQPAPEPEKPRGVLRIATVPTDMPIIVDGQPKGNSPSGEGQYFSISLEEGDHEIEILKSLNQEKEQYAGKTIFIAADTIPIVTLKAEERLTPFGVQEKERRKAEEVEKERLAEIERKKATAIAVEKKRIADEKAAKKRRKAEVIAAEKNALKEAAFSKRQIIDGKFSISKMVLTPDEALIAAGYRSGKIRFFDRATGNLTKTFEAHEHGINSLVATKDGRFLLSSESDHRGIAFASRTKPQIKLWDINTGTLEATFDGHSYGIGALIVKDNGQEFVSADDNGKINFWAIGASIPKRTLNAGDSAVKDLIFIENERKFVSVQRNGWIKIWDYSSGEIIREINHKDTLQSVVTSPNGKYIVSVPYWGSMKVWDISSGNLVHSFPEGASGVANFTPNGKYLVGAWGSEKYINVYNFASRKLLISLDGHKHNITDIFIFNNGKKVISSSVDETFRIWSISDEIAAH